MELKDHHYSENKTENLNSYLHDLLEEKNNLKSVGFSTKLSMLLLDKEIIKIKEEIISVQKPYEAKINGQVPEKPQNNVDTSKVVTKQDKIFLPVKDYPNFNFVGRILGPRGYTIKQFENKLDCRIMIRGKGSTRNPKLEETNKGQPNFEHLNEELHILLVVSDKEDKIDQRMVDIRKELIDFVEAPLNIPESQDAVKQMQLMELSILNESERHQQQQRQNALLQQHIAAFAFNPSTTFLYDTAPQQTTTQLIDPSLALLAPTMEQVVQIPHHILPTNTSTAQSTWFTQPNQPSPLNFNHNETQNQIKTEFPSHHHTDQIYLNNSFNNPTNFLNYSLTDMAKSNSFMASRLSF